TYTNLNRFNSINIGIPDGFSVEHANLSFTNIKYKPHYSSNSSYDINKINVEPQNYKEPVISCKNGTMPYKIIANDNLTLHTLDAFPDSTNDGEGYWVWGNYYEPSGNYIHVEGSKTDNNGLSLGSRTLHCHDQRTDFPPEYCYINHTKTEYGNFSFNIVYFATSSQRWDFRGGFYDNSTSSYVFGWWGHQKTGAWYGCFSGLPSPSNFIGKWIRITIAFECRDGYSSNDGYMNLNSDTCKTYLYDYLTGNTYVSNTYSFTTNLPYLSFIKLMGQSGTYKHDVWIHDMKYAIPKTQDELNDFPTPYINIIANNPAYVNSKFNITINVEANEYNISQIIFWDNISKNKINLGNSDGNYNVTLNFTQKGYYNISVKAIDIKGNWRQVNISYLFIAKRACYIDVLNLKSAYYQNDLIKINISLRDINNNPLKNKLLNITLTNQTDNAINKTTLTTDNYGNAIFYFKTNFSHLGFYHINVSFYSNEYLNYSKLVSFEILPVERNVNSSDINLQVNNHPVKNNFIQINGTNNFTFNALDNSSWDLHIKLKLNFTTNIAYSEFLSYSFEFQATDDINYIIIKVANLTNYPANFTHFYFENLISQNYRISGNKFTILDLINETFYDKSDFQFSFRYFENSIKRTQITKAPRSDTNSIIFQEQLIANRTFSYWYIKNTNDINSIRVENIRTGETVSNFEVNESKYYFEMSCNENDMLIATIDYDPDWQISYNIIKNNGTYTLIQINYKADFNIQNVTIVLDLNGIGVYNENWTLNATQSIYSYKLEIPSINFTNAEQILYIEGYSTVPHTTFSNFENEENFEISDENYKEIKQYYKAYLRFSKYSQIWIVDDIDTNWELDGIHYDEKDIDLNSDNLFRCDGWGTSISTAYLRFKTNPISSWKRSQTNNYVEYTIICNLPCKNIEFTFYIQSEARILIKKINVDYIELVNLYRNDGKEYYRLIRINLQQGKNIIRIYFEKQEIGESAWYLLLGALAMIGFVITYYEIKSNKFEKLKFWKKKRR
ncbi:MAG: hypothetical protein ACP6IY_18815, partial [Promethearchaeia archaeon]